MKTDSAVSPVIGSILLVAITVIIAAVIAAFVFGMTGDIQQTRIVAVTSDVNEDTIVLTYHGGKDHAQLVALRVQEPNDTTIATCTDFPVVAPATRPEVGSTSVCTVAAAQLGARTHVVVVGTFTDGTQQVLLDTYQVVGIAP